MNWQGTRVLVAGGAPFIGSHLTDVLVERGVKVRILDYLLSGRLENIHKHLTADRIEFTQADLREPCVVWVALKGK